MNKASQRQTLETLERLKAVLSGHFVFASGRHGSAYVNKDAVYPHTRDISRLCYEIAKFFAYDHVQVVIAPAVGGVILSQWVAYHLTGLMKEDVLGVYADKTGIQTDGEVGFIIKRGYDKLVADERVLVVEDILTTGRSVKKVVEAVRQSGGRVVGVGVLCNRGGITSEDLGDVPKLFALADIKLESWAPRDCPLCVQGIPMNTDVGKGREFLLASRAGA